MYAASGCHDVRLLSLCTFVGTLGLIQMDVMADTMCVERSKVRHSRHHTRSRSTPNRKYYAVSPHPRQFEVDDRRGQMQASCYSIRFAGSLVGAVLGTAVSSRSFLGWGLSFAQVSCVNGLIPFLLVSPWLYLLRERYPRKWSPRISNIDSGYATPSAEPRSLFCHLPRPN